MTIYQEASALLSQIADETRDMKHGTMPSVYVLMGLQGELVSLYHRLGEELHKQFTEKELSYLQRKVAAARAHLKGRNEFQLTQQDAKEEAVKATEDLYREEIDKMAIYEHSRITRDSLDHAFSYLSQVISTLKWSEQRPSTPSA